jgi:hypothetical protein
LVPIINNGTAPPTAAYAQSGSIPDDGYYWFDCEFFVAVKTTSSLTAPATLTFNNALSAINPFTNAGQTSATMTYTVVPISVSPTTATVAANGGTATVTGSDYQAAQWMDAESSYTANSGPYWASGSGGDESCNTSGGTTLATVAPISVIPTSMNSTNWTQTFTITGSNNGTGTCTFYLYDLNALTVTQAVTVTVN